MKCTKCQATIQDGYKFCVECGAKTSFNLLDKENNSQTFVRLLSEESLRILSKNPLNIPYGCAAVVLINGIVHKIQRQPHADPSKASIWTDFYRGISEIVLGLIGQKQQQVKTFLINDYKNLPFVSYDHNISIPGNPQSRLQFNFWIDLEGDDFESIGRFIQRVVGDRNNLTVSEFLQTATTNLLQILGQFTHEEITTPEGQSSILKLLNSQIGIAGQIRYSKGRPVGIRRIEIGSSFSSINCISCGTMLHQKMKFCEHCGTNLTNVDWIERSNLLGTLDGEQVTLKMNISGELIDGMVAPAYSDQKIAELIHQMIEPVIRMRTLEQLMTGGIIKELNSTIANLITKDFQGYVTEAHVVDIRSTKQEWFFKTDLIVAEELAKIETDRQMLAVGNSEIDYKEAAFAVALRKIQQSDSQELIELRQQLNTEKGKAEIEIEEHQLRTTKNLKIESIDHKADQERFDRNKEDLIRDKSLEREIKEIDREEERTQVQHEQGLEISTAKHDINLSDIVGEAKSRAKRRDVADLSYEAEESLRLKSIEANNDENIEDRRNIRQIEKMKSLADIEARMASQDHDFEIKKIEEMKGLSAQEILVMQATQLTKAAGVDGAAAVVQSLSQSNNSAEMAALKDTLYKQMIELQEKSADKNAQIQREAMEAVMRTYADIGQLNNASSTSALEGYKEAAKIAQTTNEKSMESMSKVATAVAGRKYGKEDLNEDVKTNYQCVNCKHIFEGKKKHCPECGVAQ